MTISTVIPVYKQTEQFLENLSHNLPFLSNTEIIIVNDDPQTDLKPSLKDRARVHLIENAENMGFAGAVNVGFSHATGSYVLLLNSDTRLNDVTYKNTLAHFERNPKLFAVGFAQTEQDGSLVGKNKLYFKEGFIQHDKASSMTFGPTAWAEGGSSLFSKDIFNKLGGFDILYSPFYWEDVDLSYRAWKAGYEVLFDPAVVVQHHHSGTIGTHFSKHSIQTIAFRNQLIFIWKNISDSNLLKTHNYALVRMVISSLLTGKMDYMRGFLRAYRQKNAIAQAKQRLSPSFILSDVTILEKLSPIT